MKLSRVTSNIFSTIIGIPLAIIALIILSPFIIALIISDKIRSVKEKIELKKILKLNNEKIFLIYADYNELDFLTFFEDKLTDVLFLKVKKHHYENDIFTRYLIKDCGTHAFPRLVKVSNGKIVAKVHFGSFKHLYKRKNDIKTFFKLLERSIKNLRNEN